MSTLREFTTAHTPVEDLDVIDVPIRGPVNPGEDPSTGELTVLKAYRPGDGQMAILMQSLGRGSSTVDNIAGPLNFFDSVLDADGRAYITERLLDRNDPFGLEQIEEIMQALMEEWNGRPTQPSSGSTSSQPNGGQNSTATTPTSPEVSPVSQPIATST